MQQASLKANCENSDCILLSATGSGKTLGFLLPLLEKISADKEGVQAMIIVPSRELALQIESVLKNMKTGLKVLSCYGGHQMSVERNSFSVSPQIIVGTPGRILDHIHRKNFDPSTIHSLVLDEFDKCLELGFQQEMSEILKNLWGLKKRILTSATDLEEIPGFVGMADPETLNFLDGKVKRLTTKIVYSPAADKLETLYDLLCNLEPGPTIIFLNHREAVERVSNFLAQQEIECEFFHGGLEQIDRERILCKFRNGSTSILITTDLAARGLDIPDISYVIHYQVPPKEDAFIHRNGRTARVDAEGTAFLILGADEKLPIYIENEPEVFEPTPGKPAPPAPLWITLYIGAGKKDKVNKMDIVGFLSKAGGLQRDDLGLIEVKDFMAFAAVKRKLIKSLMNKIKDEKIKGKKVKIRLSM